MTTCLWVEEAVGSNKYGLPAGCWRALSGINNQSTFQPSPSHNRLSTPLYDVCTEADSSICVIWFCVTGECSLFFVCLFWVILWGCMVVFLCFVSFLLLCFLFTIFWFGLFVLCMSNSLFNKNCYMCALAEHTIFFFFSVHVLCVEKPLFCCAQRQRSFTAVWPQRNCPQTFQKITSTFVLWILNTGKLIV